MSRPYVSVQLTGQILADAGHRCGYCRTDERLTGSPLSIEHILPIATGGPTERKNLWRSCRECNERKGAQVQATDPESGEVVDRTIRVPNAGATISAGVKTDCWLSV